MTEEIQAPGQARQDIDPSRQAIDDHLRQALSHIHLAVDLSLNKVLANPQAQKEVGKKWEEFLGEFFGLVREKGKQHRINLLTWISFPRLRH